MRVSYARRTRLVLFLLVGLILTVDAQFGIPKAGSNNEDVSSQPIDAEGELTQLTEEDATKIATLIEAAREDPETTHLVESMKNENSQELDELRQLPMEEVLNGMKITLEELMMLEVLFADKQRAFEEMNKEGLIAKEHVKKYKKNPDLLEEDTRKGLYFRFISLAVVGGYL